MFAVDYHIFKSLLNGFYARHIGGDHRPVFCDIDAVCPPLHAITRAYREIRAEFNALLSGRARLPRYHEVDTGEAAISAGEADKNWSVFMLDILGHKPEENRALCPRTCRVLEGVPNLLQAFFSVLDPGKSIPLHKGPYLGYLRYHLGLRVPSHNPPRLIVNTQPYVWREGEAVLFDDSWPHAVENQADEMRAVLVVDILRPMPLLPTLLNRLTTNLVGHHTYGRRVAGKVRQFALAP